VTAFSETHGHIIKKDELHALVHLSLSTLNHIKLIKQLFYLLKSQNIKYPGVIFLYKCIVKNTSFAYAKVIL